MKYYRYSYKEVMFKISYSNLLLYAASIPDYDPDKEKEVEDFGDLESESDFEKFFQ